MLVLILLQTAEVLPSLLARLAVGIFENWLAGHRHIWIKNTGYYRGNETV